MKLYYHQIHCMMYHPFHWNIQKKLQHKHEVWPHHQSHELDNANSQKNKLNVQSDKQQLSFQYFTNQMNLIM